MTELNLLRNEINEIDKELVKLLKKRIEVAKKIGKLKKEKKIAIFDAIREKEIIDFFTLKEDEDNKFIIEKFLHLLMDISKEVQAK